MNVLGLIFAVLLRIGIPVGITFLAAWYLRRLDARWQDEAEQLQKEVQVPVALSLRTPCWEVRFCPEKRKGDCPAYACPEIPCWQFFRENGGPLKGDCLDCVVFLEAPPPFVVRDSDVRIEV
ncbi:MAG: hypothetical protein AB1345_05870 [Chloroflexota bacterium]